jgi:enoyl-CoA hydratase
MPVPTRGTTDPWPLGTPPALGMPLPETMHALVIRRDQYGPPIESTRIETVPVPRLKPVDAGKVLVAVLASGPNFNTNFASLGLPVPVFGRGDTATIHIPGSDALGIVVDAGPAVTRVKAGQAVILDSWTGRNIRGYETHDGFNAQFAAIEEERAIPLPGPLRAFTPERLAAMLLTYGTAYRTVVERLRVGPGDSVLVMGGGKGTSFAGAQMAKLAGARVILMGSNPALAQSLIDRGMADAFVDRRRIPPDVFGPIRPGESEEAWTERIRPFRMAIFNANDGRPVTRIFEHTGGDNFPLLVSVLGGIGTLAFFGATGKGLKGEYKETFFYQGHRFVFDARWVWMRQKQILFRRRPPQEVFAEIGFLPGRRVLVWGADRYSRKFLRAALDRGAEVAVIASRSRDRRAIGQVERMGIPSSRVIDRDAFDLPEDMPDPLTPDGRLNPAYASGFTKQAQALGKATWGIFGPRQSPDVVVERPDQSTLHFSAFVARDFDENDAMPCGYVIAGGNSDLTISGSHMYHAVQAAEVVRLLAAGRIVMEQEDLEITDLAGLPQVQQKMLDGTMAKPKGVSLVQADRPGRRIAEFEEIYLGEKVRSAAPMEGRFLDVRLQGDIALVTLTRPDALNALNEAFLSQIAEMIRELKESGTLDGRPVKALVLTGAGRAFVAGADVNEFMGKPADEVEALASKNIGVFSALESLDIPVIAVVDGFALGGGNELAMSAHYRIVTENARLGQPEVKLGILPGYGGMQRLPRLAGPARAVEMCVNGEPIDGYTAVAIGLADEFATSATALPRAFQVARDVLSGLRPLPRRNWDGIGAAQREELSAVLTSMDVVEILGTPTPDATNAGDIRLARRAAGRDALLAMEYGYLHGFEQGLRNDARLFGLATASPGGQEWIRRFLAKDPAQASYLPLLPPLGLPWERARGPITKKAPGDRQISSEEIGAIASLIKAKAAEGLVTPLPSGLLDAVVSLLRERPSPRLLELFAPAGKDVSERLARLLEKREIDIHVVDLGEKTGFPRENARPVYEVLLIERNGDLLWLGKKKLLELERAKPTIFLSFAFVRKAQARPHLLLQTIIHPLIEWVFGLPHMVAVLCEAVYNAAPKAEDGRDVSDLNRFIAEEAGRERDFAYFNRILDTEYEPDEFRMEELRAHFGTDEAKIREIVSLADAVGKNFRRLMEETLAATRVEMAREQIGQARYALDEGDADQALTILRKIEAPQGASDVAAEVKALIDLAIRSYALGADPAYEGLVMEGGTIQIEPWAGAKARELAGLLNDAAEVVRKNRNSSAEERRETDPLGEHGAPRDIHVALDLERPSAKFIDGHDKVHWVLEKTFIEALLAGRTGNGRFNEAIPAILAYRFIRDGAFPDEKLKIERQYAVAVKGAIEGYRFYQSLPDDTRGQMAVFFEEIGLHDPLHRLFVDLGEETQASRASRLIRQAVARTHSYSYVRYPDTPLAGQVVVITGGGTGMGRSLALEAAIKGANVAITGRRPSPLEETKADMDDLIRFIGLTNQTTTVQGDVSDPKYVGEMFERIEREFGRIDILFNNAGVSGPVEFGSVYSEEDFDLYKETIGIHLTGSYLASLEAARVMEGRQNGGVIVMVGTFYTESVHRHVLHAYPGRLPYTSAQSAKLALGDYLAWMLAGKKIAVLSVNPSAVATERIARGVGVFDKGARARARVGRKVTPEALERDTLDRTVRHEFVRPRDFARFALEMDKAPFRRSVGGQRIAMGGVTYEQPPGVLPSPAALSRYPDLVGKVALVTVHRPLIGDMPLLEATAKGIARAGGNVILAGSRPAELERIALQVNAGGGEGMATVAAASPTNPAEVQELFDRLPRVDLLVHFTGSVDWKRPLTSLPFEDWTAMVDQFGYVPRLLSWQAEKRMDKDRIDGTIILVGPDLSGIPSIKERNLVQVFQGMLRPAVATESMERALMRKAQAEGLAPAHVSDINIGLVLPGRNDGRNRASRPDAIAASVLWLLEEGKKVSGVVLLPDEQNSLARLPAEVAEVTGTMAGKIAIVTGGIRGLGKEISLKLAGEKATVVVASRHPRPEGSPEEVEKAKADLAAADAVLTQIRRLGGRSIWIDADVSRPQRVRAVIDEARNRFGRIDAFVNNAGAGGDFSLIGDVVREHRPSWEGVLRANFVGPWAAINHLQEIMKNQPDGGTIVDISTHYADQPYLFRTIYTVSKILMKALTLGLKEPLARDNIRIADVAPSLIAGPRMDWVMRNYAGRFAEQFGAVKEIPTADRGTLQDLFLRSFERSLPLDEREAAASKFLAALRESAIPKGVLGDIIDWYGRIQEWFRATVPDVPPTNEQVADAVLYAAKNARFLEDRFLGVSSLPEFATFPGDQPARKRPVKDEPILILSMGIPGGKTDLAGAVASALHKAGARVTSIVESPGRPGQVEITRPIPLAATGRAAKGSKPPDKIVRDLDLSDPRVLESWLDNTLLGEPPPAGAVLFVGTSREKKPLLSFTDEDMTAFLSQMGKALNTFAEALRAVRPGSPIVVAAPPADTEEGILVRAGLRQIVRTFLAESYFLPLGKRAGVSLASPTAEVDGKAFAARVLDLLTGDSAPVVEAIPVGRTRP